MVKQAPAKELQVGDSITVNGTQYVVKLADSRGLVLRLPPTSAPPAAEEPTK